MVRVTRSGVRAGKRYEQTGVYLTSRCDDAAVLGAVIRSHWDVENRLHRCKDVQMTEDSGGVRSKAGAALLSLLRGIALSVLRHHGEWVPDGGPITVCEPSRRGCCGCSELSGPAPAGGQAALAAGGRLRDERRRTDRLTTRCSTETL